MAVDERHPVDHIEPLEESTCCDLHDWLTVTEKVATSYLTGDPAVTRIAWRVLLRKEPESIRACARRAGCTAAAISKRVRILMEQFNLRQTTPRLRKIRRQIACEAWKRKRREELNPPAASDDQSKTDDRAKRKGGRP